MPDKSYMSKKTYDTKQKCIDICYHKMQTGVTICQVGVMLLQPVQWAPLENKLLLVSGRDLDWGISCGLFAWHSLRCWHLTFHVGKRMCLEPDAFKIVCVLGMLLGTCWGEE